MLLNIALVVRQVRVRSRAPGPISQLGAATALQVVALAAVSLVERGRGGGVLKFGILPTKELVGLHKRRLGL